MVVCEKVTINKGTVDENEYLVQYDDQEDQHERESCLRYLADCEVSVLREPHPVVGIGDDPAVSWADLSDIAAPRD